jgi:hypothetical protein
MKKKAVSGSANGYGDYSPSWEYRGRKNPTFEKELRKLAKRYGVSSDTEAGAAMKTSKVAIARAKKEVKGMPKKVAKKKAPGKR